MFEFSESVQIKAPPYEVWSLLADVEQWWPPSNPEHIAIDVRSPDKSISVGTKIVFQERVAGVKAQAEGRITRFVPEAEATWEGIAQYQYFGLRFRVKEGVSWQLAGNREMSLLSARVWAKFSAGIFRRALEWYAKSILNVVERDRAHARCELEYLKDAIEGNSFAPA